MAKSLRSGVTVTGLRELQRALKRAEGDTGKDLRKALKGVAEIVRTQGESNAPVLSGTLAGSIRSSATLKGASVYSNVPWAYVQDRGGRVGRNHATILERGKVSAYMTRAVISTAPAVSVRLDGVLNDLEHNFSK